MWDPLVFTFMIIVLLLIVCTAIKITVNSKNLRGDQKVLGPTYFCSEVQNKIKILFAHVVARLRRRHMQYDCWAINILCIFSVWTQCLTDGVENDNNKLCTSFWRTSQTTRRNPEKIYFTTRYSGWNVHPQLRFWLRTTKHATKWTNRSKIFVLLLCVTPFFHVKCKQPTTAKMHKIFIAQKSYCTCHVLSLVTIRSKYYFNFIQNRTRSGRELFDRPSYDTICLTTQAGNCAQCHTHCNTDRQRGRPSVRPATEHPSLCLLHQWNTRSLTGTWEFYHCPRTQCQDAVRPCTQMTGWS